ncbi:MAG: response regulator transcription factor [Bdellovibrio sp.]|nr:response regulator transcription factor [Bdellovibrio sp.]
MNILVVEDEAAILKNIVIALEEQGWNVRTASTTPSLSSIIESKGYYPHVIVLDRILAGEDSSTLVQKIKETYVDTRILILSAIDTGAEKAKLLDLGADDYLAKPYSTTELIARVKALGRRSTLVHSQQELRIGNVAVNLSDRTVQIEAKHVGFSQKELQLLILFANNPGKIFPREVLLEQVWKSAKESESKVVEATMNNLRRKLEANTSNVVIRNMRNVGYWLET